MPKFIYFVMVKLNFIIIHYPLKVITHLQYLPIKECCLLTNWLSNCLQTMAIQYTLSLHIKLAIKLKCLFVQTSQKY